MNDPAGKEAYEANAKKFLAEIDTVEKDVKAGIAKLPPARRKIITTHDAFGYFGWTYGMEFIAPEGVSTDSEASARDVAKIIRQIRAEKVPAVFLENVTDHRLLDQIARDATLLIFTDNIIDHIFRFLGNGAFRQFKIHAVEQRLRHRDLRHGQAGHRQGFPTRESVARTSAGPDQPRWEGPLHGLL